MCIQAAAFSPFFDPCATSKRFFQTFNEANFLFSLIFFVSSQKFPRVFTVHVQCTYIPCLDYTTVEVQSPPVHALTTAFISLNMERFSLL